MSDPDAQMQEWEHRATQAQARGAHAFARLLAIAENDQSGQACVVAWFLTSLADSTVLLDPFGLRAVEVAVGDDILACLDTLRWAKADLCNLVPNGHTRLRRLVDRWSSSSQQAPRRFGL
jgi:hypothetical protein